jgi:hypothetical protein
VEAWQTRFGNRKNILRKTKFLLYIRLPGAIMVLAFLSGLEKAPTFLVPIINPPFADTARTSYRACKISADLPVFGVVGLASTPERGFSRRKNRALLGAPFNPSIKPKRGLPLSP